MLRQYLCIPPSLPVPAFHILPFYVWALSRAPYSSMQSPQHFLPDFLLSGMDCSWACRPWALKIHHLEKGMSSSKQGFIQHDYIKQSLEEASACSHEVQGHYIAFLSCSFLSRSWTQLFHANGSQGCLWLSHSQQALPYLWVWGTVEYLSALVPLSLGSGSCH